EILGLWLLDKSLNFAVFIGLDQTISRRVVHGDKRDGGSGVISRVKFDKFSDIEIGQNVAVENNGRLAKRIGRKFICAAGAHRARLGNISQIYAKFRAVSENVLDLVRLVTQRKRDI